MQAQLNRERFKLLKSIEKLLDMPMIVLGLVWMVLLVIELVHGLNKPLEYLSIGIWILFIIDFVVKFVLAPVKLTYLKKNWLTAISLFIPALRVLRVFRLVQLARGLRGIRLVRIVSSINRSTRSLGATMKRRGFGYVTLVALVAVFAGAAGMYALEQPNKGFDSYGAALYWTGMRIITAGSGAEPISAEGRALAFVLALFGYTVFGYVTATLATFFIGRDAEEKDAPLAGAKDVSDLQREIAALRLSIDMLKSSLSSTR